MALGEPANAVERTVTVLVIACPHALGLAIPLTIAVSTSVAASSGILIKDRLALEGMRRVDVVLFDKTGTLTAGEHEVTDLAVAGVDEHRLLTLASAVEAESEHPLARAIIARAGQDDAVGRGSDHRSLAGRGVTATVDGVETAVGGPALLEDRGVEVPEALAETTEQWRERGASVLHVIADGEVVGAFAMEDAIRPESADAVRALPGRKFLGEPGRRLRAAVGIADQRPERRCVDDGFCRHDSSSRMRAFAFIILILLYFVRYGGGLPRPRMAQITLPPSLKRRCRAY